MASVDPHKFQGKPLDVIALVDSRHDFKGFSQDTVATPRGFPGQSDYVQHFHNNLQRISLGLGQEYSRRLTSSCRGPDVLGIGPETDFLAYIDTYYATPANGWTGIDLNLDVLGEVLINKDFAKYHRIIANNIYELPQGGPVPIPLIVDTHRTLTHNSEPYFIVCRNKECVADPSKTSTQNFNWIANEIDEQNRTYRINNVTHTISGTLDNPSVRYSFERIGDEGEGYTETLQFKRIGGHKPNEINICKTRIQKYISDITRPIPADGPSYFSGLAPSPPGTNITFCDNYDKIIYTDNLNNKNKQKIAFSYVAKRAGDQLQVLSCLPPVDQSSMLPVDQRITYYIPAIPGMPEISTEGNYKISNCVFWTIDVVAACFAILNNITTVIQHPDKSITIYKKNDYRPNYEPMPAGGKQKKNQKGGVCTRGNLKNALNGDITDNCWNMAMLSLCDITSDYYEPWTLLNFLVYYLNTTEPGSSVTNTLNGIYNFVSLSNNNCLCVRPVDVTEPYNVNNTSGNIILYHDSIIIIYVKEVFWDYIDIHLRENGLMYRYSLNDIVQHVSIYKQHFYEYIEGSDFIVIEGMGGGNRNTFYDNWKQLEKRFNINDAKQLFLDFIELLSICETQYFQHIDVADNYYVYNPKSTVTIGGHTQIELLSFIKTLIMFYKNVKNNINKLEVFLKIFICFPSLLKKHNVNFINIELQDYIGSWFNYKPIFMDESIITEYDEIFSIIIKQMYNNSKIIYSKVSSDNEKAAKYLHTIFPHGYFTIEFNKLTAKPSTSLSLKTNKLHKLRQSIFSPPKIFERPAGGKYILKKTKKNKHKKNKRKTNKRYK
jgi:hypothetical protein